MAETKIKNQKPSPIESKSKASVTSGLKSGVRRASKKTSKNSKPGKTELSAGVKTAKTARTLSADVYDITGRIVDSMDLPKEIFGIKVNKQLIAQAVRIYLANQRAGSASTKTRGEVQGSTRKIYRQKGTGRARHGGIRAPIFVHGGIAHGPKPKDYGLKLPQKMKRVALLSALSAKTHDGSVAVITGADKIEPKTKKMEALLINLGLKAGSKKILLVLDGKHDNITRASRNLEGVTYEYVRQLHTYEVLNNNKIVFLPEAIEELKKTFLRKK